MFVSSLPLSGDEQENENKYSVLAAVEETSAQQETCQRQYERICALEIKLWLKTALFLHKTPPSGRSWYIGYQGYLKQAEATAKANAPFRQR